MNETSFRFQRRDVEIKVYIPLSKKAALALSKLADKEHRDPKQQASWIIESELIRLGLIDDRSELRNNENTKVEEGSSGKSSR